jgi:hypothetical protein
VSVLTLVFQVVVELLLAVVYVRVCVWRGGHGAHVCVCLCPLVSVFGLVVFYLTTSLDRSSVLSYQ